MITMTISYALLWQSIIRAHDMINIQIPESSQDISIK